MHIFLDDERSPSDVTWVTLPNVEWAVVRNPDDFKRIVSVIGIPETISFDNDLGVEEEGRHLVKWLVECVLDGKLTIPHNFSYVIHSKNPIASNWMRQYLNSFIKFSSSN